MSPDEPGNGNLVSNDPIVAPGMGTVAWLGTAMIGIFVMLVYLLARAWPAKADCAEQWCSVVYVFGSSFSVGAEVRLIFVALLAGSLGSFIHQATSFADFVGNGRLTRSWVWWYVLRVPIGGALAVVFYLLLRGGFIGPKEPSIHGVAGFAALAGLFSRQATDKAREVFEVLFRSQVNTERAHKLDEATVAPAGAQGPVGRGGEH